METKLYLIEEHQENIFDAEKNSEWLNLVKELGLEKQEKLMGNDKGKILSPLPFPSLTLAEGAIYTAIFDKKVLYTDYSSQAIPLNCLSLIALCEREKYFQRIEIWSTEQIKDPFIIGTIFSDPEQAKSMWFWGDRTYYKIAQWGDKLKSLNELLPLWDNLQRTSIRENYDNAIKNHEKEMERFSFQINSFI